MRQLRIQILINNLSWIGMIFLKICVYWLKLNGNVNTKFQASRHLLWLYSPVYVNLVGKPEDRFSHNEAQIMLF